jgi:hypothetical protein
MGWAKGPVPASREDRAPHPYASEASKRAAHANVIDGGPAQAEGGE